MTDEYIYIIDGVDEKTKLPKLKAVLGETIFPSKEPKYSIWTKIRWKFEKLFKR